MLSGGKGNDLLIGGGDHDVLIGGPGLDKFQCNGEGDLILDFNPKRGHRIRELYFPNIHLIIIW